MEIAIILFAICAAKFSYFWMESRKNNQTQKDA